MQIERWVPQRWRAALWLAAVLALGGCAALSVEDAEWRNGRRVHAAQLALEPCAGHFAAHVAEGEALLAAETEEHQRLIERALAYRARTLERVTALKQQAGPLSGEDLQGLNQGLLAHLELREALMQLALRHECWLTLPESQQAALAPHERLTGVMLSLSAALVLYDNYLLAVSAVEEDPRLRRVLNGADAGYGLGGGNLNGVAASYYSLGNRERVRSAIAFYERELPRLTAAERGSGRLRYLAGLIEQSPSYDMTRAASPAAAIGRKVRLLDLVTTHHLTELGKEGVNLFSMLFGNSVGLVETRKGKLFGRPEVRSELARTLRAGDILLEKTPFRLTDALIPGHFGHAAIWIGGEQELRELGIWEHPAVLRHQGAIRAGSGVVEALRPGVQLNGLDHFLNIDDLAVLREQGADPARRAEVLLETMRQIGKEYDFNFDVETTDRIVCSELVYLSFGHIAWPTERSLGRATISPDHIAAKALHGGPLELLLLYSDGERIGEGAEARLAALLAAGEPPVSRWRARRSAKAGPPPTGRAGSASPPCFPRARVPCRPCPISLSSQRTAPRRSRNLCNRKDPV